MIRVGEVDIHYLTGGVGEALVILHGGGDGSNAWLQNAKKLSRHYNVYIPDMPGFGRSQTMTDSFNLTDFVKFVEDFTHGLGLERFHLVGHSIGGCIALHYAFQSPHKVIRLALVSSFCLGKEVALWVRLLSSVVFRKSLGEPAIAIMKAVKWLVSLFWAPFKFVQLITRLKVDIGRTITTLRGQTIVLNSQLSKLMVPTLLVWGAKDGIVPASHALAAAQLIPNSQLKLFENCGHNVHRQKADEFSELLLKFFD